MWIESLRTKNFRNLNDEEVRFNQGLNWLIGPNGQGKTNCLEAIYFVMTTKSFRTSRNADLFRDRRDTSAIQSTLVKNKARFRFSVELQPGKVGRFLGDKPCKPIDFFETAVVMAFTARDKILVEGSPSDRRQLLDRMIASIDPNYIGLIARYRQILNQCRKLLLQRNDLTTYRGFKRAAIPIALKIVEKRQAFLEAIRVDTLEIHQSLFAEEEPLFFRYRLHNCPSREQYAQRMLDVCAEELLHGRGVMGPHLDDMDIRFINHKAKHFASSGQVRSIALSLKLAVRNRYHEQTGFYPPLLLDDIDAELDSDRLFRLLNYLDTRGQTLISTSKYGTIQGRLHDHVYMVQGGCISPERISE